MCIICCQSVQLDAHRARNQLFTYFPSVVWLRANAFKRDWSFFFLRSQYELKQAAFKQTRPLPDRDLVGLCYTGVLHCRSGERKKTLPLPGISGGKKFCVKVITLAESLSYSSFCRSLSLHCLQRLSLAFTGRRCCGY